MTWLRALSTETVVERIPEWPGKKGEGFLIYRGELFTEREAKRMKIPMEYLEKVELPRSRIYRFFGCRFDSQDMENPVRRDNS